MAVIQTPFPPPKKLLNRRLIGALNSPGVISTKRKIVNTDQNFGLTNSQLRLNAATPFKFSVTTTPIMHCPAMSRNKPGITRTSTPTATEISQSAEAAITAPNRENTTEYARRNVGLTPLVISIIAIIMATLEIGFMSAISGIPRMKERIDEFDLSPMTPAKANGISTIKLIKRKLK